MGPPRLVNQDLGSMIILDKEEVQAHTIASLGLDATVLDLFSPEALSSIVRRAAAFHTPCTKRSLRELVHGYLHALTTPDIPGDLIDDTIETLAGSGDLIELPALDREVRGSLLYIAPPTFVTRSSGEVILLGAFPDDGSPFPQGLKDRIEYRGHTRRLVGSPDEHLDTHLKDLGLIEMPDNLWLRKPRVAPAEDVVRHFNELLDARAILTTSEGFEGLLVLDPSRDIKYYSGRWRTPTLPGRFVARREQRYGSPLWGYVEIAEDRPKRLLDLPESDWRGCDDAWRLQCAIDAAQNHPQVFRLRNSPPKGTVIVDFFRHCPRGHREDGTFSAKRSLLTTVS